MREERRKQRSEYWDLALQYFLQARAQRNKLVGLILADTSGLLVSSTMSRAYSERIAARAPMLIKRKVKLDSPMGKPVQIQKLSVGSDPLYICAVGGPGLDEELFGTIEGDVKRIIGPN